MPAFTRTYGLPGASRVQKDPELVCWRLLVCMSCMPVRTLQTALGLDTTRCLPVGPVSDAVRALLRDGAAAVVVAGAFSPH